MALTKATMPLGSLDSLPKLLYSDIRGYQSFSSTIYCHGRDTIDDGGQGMFVLDAEDKTSPDNDGSILIDAIGRRWKREESYLDMAWFGAKQGSNIAAAWDRAVAVVDAHARNVSMESRPTIYLRSGVYTTNRNLRLPSWVSVVAVGNVEIQGKGLARADYICSIKNIVAGIKTTHNSGWNLGAIGGTLKFLGEGYEGSSALYVGNTENQSDVRNVNLYAVATGQVDTALTFGSINTYLFTATKCHFEGSNVALYSPNSTSSNSGERMVFNDSVFAGSKMNHFHIATPGMDVTFNNCSFDFTNGNVMYGTPTWGYSKINFNYCHFEGYDGNLIKVDEKQSSHVGTNRAITLNGVVNLPRVRAHNKLYNSPSRVKIDAKGTPVYINGFDQRHESYAYTEDIFLASSDTALTIAGYIKDPYYQVPSRGHILNRGWDIGDEEVGTSVNSSSSMDALKRFTCISRGNMTATVSARGAGKMLTLTGTTGAYIKFTTKAPLPITSRGRVGAHVSLSAGASTGSIQCTMGFTWYDSQGEVLGTTDGYAFNLRTVFDNASLPNYSEGNNRFIASTLHPAKPPAGAVSFKPTWQVSGFSGDVNLSRMVCCELP